LHRSNEQAILEDKLAVEDMKSNSVHIEHQQKLEDMSLDLKDMSGMSLDIAGDRYHRDTWHNLENMSHEWGKEQSNLRYIHHLGIEVRVQDNLRQGRTGQSPKHKYHRSTSPTQQWGNLQ